MTTPVEASTAPRFRHHRLLSAAALTAMSQTASSITNLLLLLVVAHRCTPFDVGRAAILVITFQVSLGIGRALLGEVAIVRAELIGELDSSGLLRSSVLIGCITGLAF